jgi:hypothetical protein
MDRDGIIRVLSDALADEQAAVVLRSHDAIAELRGPMRPRAGGQWLTLGEEGASHLHVRLDRIDAIKFREAQEGNAALEVFDRDGAMVFRISFRHTNPARPENFDSARLAALHSRFNRLAVEGGNDQGDG